MNEKQAAIIIIKPRSIISDVMCADCNKIVGWYVEKDGQALLQMGIVLLWSFHGYCPCGRELHFASTDIIAVRLLECDNRLHL